MPTEPSTSPGIGEALRCWMQARFGGEVEAAETPSANTSGFDSAIHFVRYRGTQLPEAWTAPLVIRVKPSVAGLELARHEADVQNWLADREYPAPRVLAVITPGEICPTPAQVMERAPGVDVFTRAMRQPWTLLRRLRQLVELQVRLHAVEPDGFPAGGGDLLDRRLALVRRVAVDLDDEGLRSGLERIEALSPRLRAAPRQVGHGDYHPLNAVTDGDSVTIIDWSEAGLGDPHGDVARTVMLFGLARIAAENAVERTMLRVVGPLLGRYYLRCYRRSAPLDAGRLRLWTPVHLLHSWSQAVGANAGSEDGQVDLSARLAPSLADEFRERFEAALRMVDDT